MSVVLGKRRVCPCCVVGDGATFVTHDGDEWRVHVLTDAEHRRRVALGVDISGKCGRASVTGVPQSFDAVEVYRLVAVAFSVTNNISN